MIVVAYQTRQTGNGARLFESSGGSTPVARLDKVFSFMLEPQAPDYWDPQHDRCIRVAWELDAMLAPILKLLGQERCRKLLRAKRCYVAPFNIFYIPGKTFSVEHIPTKQRASFYDLQQYFPELSAPDSVEEVQMLGRKLLYELHKMDLDPTKLTSPVKIYEECVLEYLDLPKLVDIPKEVAEYAVACMGRSWIEAHQLGYWPEAKDYDLTSAYANVAKDLPDIRYGRWLQSKNYQPNAIYGYVDALVTIYPGTMVHPILYETEDGTLESRVGTWQRKTQKCELDFIDKWGIGEYKILDGYWLMPPKRFKGELPKPLNKSTENLLKYKQITGLQAALAKRMSMFSGKFGEQRENGLGPFFNPVWKAEINTQVNLQVADWLYSNKIGPGNDAKYQYLIHVSVDGVLLTIDLPARGQWRQSYVGPALSVSSGLLYYANKKPKGLRLEDIMAMFNEHPNKGYYERQLKRRVTLADSLGNGKFEDLGREKVMVSSIDFYRQSYDRDFPKVPKTGGALLKNKYRSKPRRV